jgi:hypothetical protein
VWISLRPRTPGVEDFLAMCLKHGRSMQILNGKKIDSKKNGKKNGKKIDSKRRNKEWKKIIQNEEILSDLELDK